MVWVSTSTTRRRLREAGLIGRKQRKKPRLTSRHKKSRLEFARTHIDSWTVGPSHLDSYLISIQSKIRWDQITTMVQEQNPTSVKELWTAINSAWEGFPSDRLNDLIASTSRVNGKKGISYGDSTVLEWSLDHLQYDILVLFECLITRQIIVFSTNLHLSITNRLLQQLYYQLIKTAHDLSTTFGLSKEYLQFGLWKI